LLCIFLRRLGNLVAGFRAIRLSFLAISRPPSICLPELVPQFLEHRDALSGHRLAEVQKHLERRRTNPIIKLKAPGVNAVQMPRLLNRECRAQFLPTNVHIERGALHVEEVPALAEAIELTFHLCGRSAIGHDYSYGSKALKVAYQFFPPGDVQFRDPI